MDYLAPIAEAIRTTDGLALAIATPIIALLVQGYKRVRKLPSGAAAFEKLTTVVVVAVLMNVAAQYPEIDWKSVLSSTVLLVLGSAGFHKLFLQGGITSVGEPKTKP